MKMPSDPPDVSKIFGDKDKMQEVIKNLERADVHKFVDKVNDNYYYWDEIRYRSPPKDIKNDSLWALIKLLRTLKATQINIGKTKLLDIKFNLSNPILEKLHEFDMNLGGSISTTSIIPEEDRDRYLISSLMEEAIASSQLEGAVTTRKVAKEMLRTSRKPRDRSEQMILNNYLTIKRIIELKNDPLTTERLLEIHALITRNTLDDKKYEGRFRDTNDVHVIDRMTGESVHVPPDHKLVPQLVRDVCDFANKMQKQKFIHPIIKASILHFLIGFVHPFEDGNGRAARAIFYWYLISNEYWLIEYMPISKTIIRAPSQYARAYLHSEKDENDVTYFIKYKIRTIHIALKDLKEYISKKIKEKDKLFKFLQIDGLNDRQRYILNKLSEDSKRTLTINEAKNTFDVVYHTARSDLLHLENLGFIERRMIGNKYIFIRAKDFDQVIKKKMKESKKKRSDFQMRLMP